MSGNYLKSSKSLNKHQSLSFKNALQDLQDHNQYDYAPRIQQYDFGMPSPKHSISPKSPQKPSNQNISSSNQREELQKSIAEAHLIQSLRKKVQRLEKENSQLRSDKQQLVSRIQLLEHKLSELNKNLSFQKSKHNNDYYQVHSLSNNRLSTQKKLSKQHSLRSPTNLSNNPVLLKQLLLECNESSEFNEVKDSMKTRSSKKQRGSGWDRDQFYEYKDTKDCFSPFFEHLSRELQLRCKKAMIREKELIFKDDHIEIGCISRKLQDLEFELNVVVTNLQTHSIKNLNIAYLSKSDVELRKQLKSTNLDIVKSTKDHTIYTELGSAEQIKENISIKAHTVDFRCILISLQFTDARGQQHKITQILPACKHRLLNHSVATPIPPSFIPLQRVILLDKKFLPELDKLKSYYKTVHFTTDRHKNTQALLNIQFLSKPFFVTFKMIGPDKIAIAVHHPQNQYQVASKILNQFTFIFER